MVKVPLLCHVKRVTFPVVLKGSCFRYAKRDTFPVMLEGPLSGDALKKTTNRLAMN